MDLPRTVADGCERLRTVADGCGRFGNVERTHPQPPDPQSETGTLATHSGNMFKKKTMYIYIYIIIIYIIRIYTY